MLARVDFRDRRITPEPSVGILSRYGQPWHVLVCPSCGKTREFRGDLDLPVSRIEIRSFVLN